MTGSLGSARPAGGGSEPLMAELIAGQESRDQRFDGHRNGSVMAGFTRDQTALGEAAQPLPISAVHAHLRPG